MPDMSYSAEISISDDEPCACGSCGWRGPAGLLKEIEDCALDPGDASPAGRCSECDSLAYLDRPADRVREAAPALREALAEMAQLLVDIDEAGGFAILRRRFLKFPDDKGAKRYLAAHDRISAADAKARAALTATE